MLDHAASQSIITMLLPFQCLEASFMQQALIGLLLLAPMAAAMGVQVITFRMAFFADAISHSAFAGVALAIILSISPPLSMLAFGIVVGLAIMRVQRTSALSSDTVIGVFFSTVVAFGLAVVSRDRNAARDMQRFLYGDILTIGDDTIAALAVLFAVIMTFQAIGYNQMLYIGFNPLLAKVHKVKVALYQYCFAALLAVVVIFSVWAVGVLLVTALLVVPAATARNLASSAGTMFWWAIAISLTSSVAGLIISAQEWANTATGATIILVASIWFFASLIITSRRAAPL